MIGGAGVELRALVAACALVFVASCAKPQAPLFAVAGTIAVKKRPLASGTVVFHPDLQKGNTEKREPRAIIASDVPGAYSLRTDNQEGAPAGWYKVTVFALKSATGTVRPPEWLADQKYTDEKTSGLSVEVVQDAKSGAYDFDLAPP
jgi:hypothetical protein